MKKIKILCVIMGVALFAGCGMQENDEIILNEQYEDVEDIDSTDEIEEEVDAVISTEVQEQISLIQSFYDVWSMEDTSYYYTIADVNQNGRLEVIASSTQGTSMVTSSSYFEVSEDKSSLVQWEMNLNEYESEAFIMANDVQAYYDADNDVYTYVYMTPMRERMGNYYEFMTVVSYTDEMIDQQTLGYLYLTYDIDTEEEITTYHNDNGEEISEAEYEALIANQFATQELCEFQFLWVPKEELDDLSTIYEGFVRK